MSAILFLIFLELSLQGDFWQPLSGLLEAGNTMMIIPHRCGCSSIIRTKVLKKKKPKKKLNQQQ
jgi:hypothetical protein